MASASAKMKITERCTNTNMQTLEPHDKAVPQRIANTPIPSESSPHGSYPKTTLWEITYNVDWSLTMAYEVRTIDLPTLGRNTECSCSS